MADETARFGLLKPRWSEATRFLRRLAVGLVGVVVLLWFAARVERINSERGIEATRSTGLSSLDSYPKRSFMTVLPQAKLAQIGVATQGRQIARNASLRISVRDFSAARASVEEVVKAQDGFVNNMTITYPDNSSKSLSAQIAIPSASSDAAIEEFRKLGRMEEESEGSEEVTAQSEELDVRLRNARAAEDRLADILRMRTNKVSDVLEVEREQTRVRGEIESMETEEKRLNRRVVFTLIDLNLTEDFHAKLGIRSSLTGLRVKNALIEGLHDAADGFLAVTLALLSAGPSLILWASIFFWPTRWAWRRWRNSRAQNAATT